MSILNPDHLLDQASKLVEPPPAGPPRQVDVRRAISSAYYAVFHATLTAAADLIIGRRMPARPSTSHEALCATWRWRRNPSAAR